MEDDDFLKQAMLAAYPASLEAAMKGYGHICEPVMDRANREAIACAASALLAIREAIAKQPEKDNEGA